MRSPTDDSAAYQEYIFLLRNINIYEIPGNNISEPQ